MTDSVDDSNNDYQEGMRNRVIAEYQDQIIVTDEETVMDPKQAYAIVSEG